jgi:hypothetical protein
MLPESRESHLQHMSAEQPSASNMHACALSPAYAFEKVCCTAISNVWLAQVEGCAFACAHVSRAVMRASPALI